MFFRFNRITFVGIVAVLFGVSATVYSARLSYERNPLPTEEITIDPPFATVGEHSDHLVTIEVTDPTLKFRGNKLTLKKQRFRWNGESKFVPIAQLHDDGKDGDAQAGDHIFSGVVSFHERVTGSIRLRAFGWSRPEHQHGKKSHKWRKKEVLVSRDYSLPARLACGPTANILPVNIFEADHHKNDFEPVEFEVPADGKAVLRLVNGAQVGASLRERVALAKILMNGKRVKTVTKWSNVAEVPVDLKQGINVLDIDKIYTKTGQRLSARIDACADQIMLASVPDTLVIGESLQAEAMLTGLGRPVRDAQIDFEVVGLGDVAQRIELTNSAGIASTTLTGFQRAGTGELIASASHVEPELFDTVPVQVFETPSIVLEQSIPRTRVEIDANRHVSFFIKFLKDDTMSYHITFETGEPNEGIDVYTTGVPPGGFLAMGPSTFVVQATIEGRTPGTYMLTTQATIEETGETVSARMEVKVIDPQPVEELVLGPPAISPAAITVDTLTPVRFAVAVSGVSNPPAFLELEEFDPQSGWVLVSELFDDGLDGDMIADNLVYARRIDVAATEEGDKRFRVVSRHDGETVVSDIRTLEVSRFFTGPDPRPPVFVEDPTTGQKFVAERVIVSFLPSVSDSRIKEIVEQTTQAVTGQAGRVNGYTRQINVYRVELVLDPNVTEAVRAEAVKAAVAEFESYDEVRYAHPNLLIEFAQVNADGNSSGVCSSSTGQWGASQIQAPEAWALPGGSGSNVTPGIPIRTVAVLDSGVKANHPDLTGKVTGNPDDDDLVDVSTQPGGHGTKVAGVITATHANVGGVAGISGIAYGLPVPILSYSVGSSFSTKEKVRDKILEAADAPDVGIINISTESIITDHDDWKCALQYATYPGTTVDTVCTGKSEEESNGKGKLVVVAAGNNGKNIREILPSDLIRKRYPCSYNYDGMLCVANTDDSDNLHPTSNYGEESAGMDLAAPGTDICTTNKNDLYGHSGDYYTGTSLAAPHVSAAAAIVWSLEADSESEATLTTAKNVANRLKDNTDPIVSGNPAGRGRLNLFKAVNKIPVAEVDFNTATEGGVTVFGNVISNDEPGDAPATVSAATQGSSTITVGSPFTTANGGTLIILDSNGNYSYTPPSQGSVPPDGLSEVFNYTIADVNGDTASATLTISVADSPLPLITVFSDEVAYAAAVGAQLFFIDFNGLPVGLAEGNFAGQVDFGSPESLNPSQVLFNSDAFTDTGSTTALNGVGPIDGTFATPVQAFGLLFSSSGNPQTIELYTSGESLIDTVTSNPGGFFGVLSATPIGSFIIRNGEFSPGNRDRYFIDDFRANQVP